MGTELSILQSSATTTIYRVETAAALLALSRADGRATSLSPASAHRTAVMASLMPSRHVMTKIDRTMTDVVPLVQLKAGGAATNHSQVYAL